MDEYGKDDLVQQHGGIACVMLCFEMLAAARTELAADAGVAHRREPLLTASVECSVSLALLPPR